MTPAQIAVTPWPGSPPFASGERRLAVLALAAPATRQRAQARAIVRATLREVLAGVLGCAPADVPLIAAPGAPLRLAPPAARIGLSVSHEAGLSLLAIHLDGPVGVDLMRIEPLPDWQVLARDYLGSAAAARIAAASPARRPEAFAAEWTRLEAARKCLGLGLAEWNAASARQLSRCRSVQVAMPDGFAGALATLVPQLTQNLSAAP